MSNDNDQPQSAIRLMRRHKSQFTNSGEWLVSAPILLMVLTPGWIEKKANQRLNELEHELGISKS